MFRNPEDTSKLGKQTVNCLLADGGMGDILASLVAVEYITKNYPWINLLVWLPDYMIDYAKHVLSPGPVIRGYSEAKKKYKDDRIGITTKWDGRTSPMRIHPVDYAFLRLCDENPNIEHKNYLKIRPDEIDISQFELPNEYVVIPVTATEKVKTMPNSTINELSQYVRSKGYTPVYIGKSNNNTGHKNLKVESEVAGIDYSLGINLCDNTSLLETAAIIARSACIVCMDGGPVHLAGSTETPIVAYYSFIDWRHNIPIRNNQIGWNCYPIEPDVKCKFCQTRLNMLFSHDYRNCYYDDYQCVKEATADKFISKLEMIL